MNRIQRAALALPPVLLALMSCLPAWAVQPLGCLIEPFRVAEVGSPVIGVIETIRAERGDRVEKGQPLATLRADVERASVDVALSRAQAIGEYNAAVANAELARQKLVRARDLADQNFISTQALEQARSEAAVADNRLAQAREQRGILAREHELAQAQLQLRTIRSPTSGVIADRYLSVGERVEEKAVFRVAVVDPLRVEVVLPASLYGGIRAGMSMTVTPEFPGAGPRQAKVVLVDKLIDGASNTFRVRLELPNANLALPAGLRCKADMASLSGAPAQAPARSRAANVASGGPSAASGLALRMETGLSSGSRMSRP
ncbi:MAG: efflux RND transporter periplasmic adaptor subunit [Burkholderiaceae bacterium]|nr:efflux RND transporter periplasmic adaptor subunit [Burkholderiaceae bacterium]